MPCVSQRKGAPHSTIRMVRDDKEDADAAPPFGVTAQVDVTAAAAALSKHFCLKVQ